MCKNFKIFKHACSFLCFANDVGAISHVSRLPLWAPTAGSSSFPEMLGKIDSGLYAALMGILIRTVYDIEPNVHSLYFVVAATCLCLFYRDFLSC